VPCQSLREGYNINVSGRIHSYIAIPTNQGLPTRAEAEGRDASLTVMDQAYVHRLRDFEDANEGSLAEFVEILHEICTFRNASGQIDVNPKRGKVIVAALPFGYSRTF
jgi:hypothetical protein